MSEELTSLVRELLITQTAAGRCAVLAGLDRKALEALFRHFAAYGPQFPDGRINCTLIGAALLDCKHREQSLAVIEDFRQEAPHVAS